MYFRHMTTGCRKRVTIYSYSPGTALGITMGIVTRGHCAIMVFFELFSNNPEIIAVESGKALFSEGEDGHQMFVLVVGSAEIIVKNRVVETIFPGNVVGEMGLVSPGPRSATVVAKTRCEFVAIDEKRFQYLVQQTPFFATQVMRVLAERLRATDELLPLSEDV